MKQVSPLMTRLGPHFLYKLYCFYFVVHFGNYHRAADYLHLSQSALSRIVQALEGRLNLKLLHRKTRCVLRVSPEGAGIYLYSTQLVALLEALEQSLMGKCRPKNYNLGFALPEWIWCDYFLEALESFKTHHPEGDLRVQTLEAVDQLLKDLFAIWIGIDSPDHPGIFSKPLFELKTTLYASPAITVHSPVQSLADSEHHRGIYAFYFNCSVVLWAEPYVQSLYKALTKICKH